MEDYDIVLGARGDRRLTATDYIQRMVPDFLEFHGDRLYGDDRAVIAGIGTIGGLPRLMDMGQCNDAYSAIKVAVALAEAFDGGVNDLPLSMVLSWYEQKAVCILLTLLHLGFKNIRLGPSLPSFVSPNVLNYLVENYRIAPISTPEDDLKIILQNRSM